MTQDDTATLKPTAVFGFDPDDTTERGVLVRYRDHPQSYRLSFGDGTVTTVNRPNQMVPHTYEKAGAYTAQARDMSGKLLASIPVVIEDGLVPPLTLTQTEDANDYNWVYARVPGTALVACQYELDFGGGSEPVRVWIAPGGEYARALADGEHHVGVLNLHTRRRTTLTVDVKSPYDPDFKTAFNPDDATGMSALLTITKLGTVKAVTIDQGNGTITEIPTPAKDQVVTLDYTGAEPGKFYLLKLSYSDGTGKPYTEAVDFPWK